MVQKRSIGPVARPVWLAGCSAAAMAGVLAGAPASAQVQVDSVSQPEGQASEVEEVVVTGIRGSLTRAIDVKRNSDTIVDSIASEDLGKFPDSNVAESLQRITGVSIDRSGGEGQFVTVRGFGPQFNNVLVNGRTIATENAGRAFSFDLLSAELISGADVYKSANARLQEGGIGSTINTKTARPFDIGETRGIFSAQANYEDLSEEAAGEVFGLYSTTFAEDRFGLLVAVSHQERKARIDQVATNGYFETDLTQLGLDDVLFPQNYDQISDEQERTRTGVNVSAQFRPNDRLLFTVDGLYNDFEVKSEASSIGHFFSPSEVTAATLDENRTVVSLAQGPNGKTDFISRTFNRPTEIRALGFNAAWEVTDYIDLSFDSSYSKAESKNGGNEIFAVVGFSNPVNFSIEGGGLPSITAAVPGSFTDASQGRAHFATREGFDTSETLYENRFDAVFRTDYAALPALRAGLYHQDRSKENVLLRSDPNVGCAYCGYGTPVPAGLLRPFNPGSFLDGEGGNFPRQWLTFDAEQYFAFLESPAAAAAQDRALGVAPGTIAALLAANNGYAAERYPDSYVIDEQIVAGYVQADFEATIGGLPWSGNVGLRYVHTDVTSDGSQQVLLDLRTIPNDPTAFTAVFAEGSAPVTRETTYDDFLPSLNVKVEFTDEIVGRFAASRTITRPNLTDLAPRVSFTNLRPGNLQATGGNPDLQPFKSTNFDGSFEWYYQEAGFFTVGAFFKRVENFIVSQVAPEAFTVANADGIFPGGQATFNVRRPRNLEEADVYGLEIGFQHVFDYLPAPFDGFGLTANATIVESSASVEESEAGQTFALEGLGDSQNLTVFYESGPIEARVAYNRRDSFLQTLANGTGGDPIYVKTQDQVDLQARYALTESISVFFEGVNVTNEKVERVGRFGNQFLNLTESGARYAVGARLQF